MQRVSLNIYANVCKKPAAAEFRIFAIIAAGGAKKRFPTSPLLECVFLLVWVGVNRLDCVSPNDELIQIRKM